MKLRKEIVNYLAKRIVEHLDQEEIIEFDGETESIEEIVENAIMGDLMVEDRLNDEVKAILAEQEETLDENNINYRKMFNMIKMKLARERGLIL